MNIAPGQFTAEAGTPLGERLHELREQHGLTLRELAERIGVSATAIHAWECGRRNPKLKHIQAFADAFRLSQGELLHDLAIETVRPQRGAAQRRRGSPPSDARLAGVFASCKEQIAEAAGIPPERVRIVIEV